MRRRLRYLRAQTGAPGRPRRPSMHCSTMLAASTASCSTAPTRKVGSPVDSSQERTRAPFEPEEAQSFEVGAKTSFLDNRVNLNLAFFRTEYTNLQVQITEIDEF